VTLNLPENLDDRVARNLARKRRDHVHFVVDPAMEAEPKAVDSLTPILDMN
jgi:hypothetical protein